MVPMSIGRFPEMSHFVAKHGHLRSFLGMKKARELADGTVEKVEADEKKQRLKDKIREKRLKRQGK